MKDGKQWRATPRVSGRRPARAPLRSTHLHHRLAAIAVQHAWVGHEHGVIVVHEQDVVEHDHGARARGLRVPDLVHKRAPSALDHGDEARGRRAVQLLAALERRCQPKGGGR